MEKKRSMKLEDEFLRKKQLRIVLKEEQKLKIIMRNFFKNDN
jgi:hypothetical protein